MTLPEAGASLDSRRALPESRRAAIVHVDVDRPLEPVAVPPGYPTVMVVVHLRGSVVGHVLLPARKQIPVAELWQQIALRHGRVIWRERLRRTLAEVARASGAGSLHPDPPVSVVVCTRDRPEHLVACLDSLAALRTAPAEVLVVDNAPSDDATRRLCEGRPVRYVVEPIPGQTRARNRAIVESAGSVVAFTDDDCVVDERWLDGLGEAFADPLVMAVTGYTGPLELEHHAQYLFEVHGGFDRHAEARVFDPLRIAPSAGSAKAGAGANMLFRRAVFDRIGLFAEDLGPGTPARAGDDKDAFYRVLAAGYRIAYDPSRIVWHRHRADWSALLRALEDYGVAEVAYTSRALVRYRDPTVIGIWRWWARHFAVETRRVVQRRPTRVPLALTASEMRGVLKGPWSMVRSARSRAGIPPVALPAAGRDGRALGAADADRAPRLAVGSEPPAGLTATIASRNRSAILRRILLALARQDHPADRLEVVVALDGSTDDSATMVRALELPYALRVVEHDRRGAAATRNRAAAEATQPVLVFLDDDIVPVPEFLSEHARAHADADAEHMAMGYSRPVISATGLWPFTLRAWWADHFRRKAAAGHRWRFTDVLAGNASLPRRLFVDTGGYDEDFGGRREDWEQGVRLLRRGVRLSYLPAAEAAHHLDVRFVTAVRNARQEGRDDVRLASKHPDVGASLPLIRLASVFTRRPRRAEAILHTLARLEPLLPATLAALDALEAAQLRRRWKQLAERVLLRSYVLGLLEAVPDSRALGRLVRQAAAAAEGESLALWLDRPAPVLPSSGLTPAKLLIGHAGRPLAAVPAVPPGGQWDWRALSERVVRAAAEPALLALALSELDAGARPQPSLEEQLRGDRV